MVAGAGRLLEQVGGRIESGVNALVDSDTGQALGSEVSASLAELRRVLHVRGTQKRPPGQILAPPCPRCGVENRPEARYCTRCAASLAVEDYPLRLAWRGGASSDPGRVRPNNEDRVELWPGTGGRIWAALVADGMGGAAAGEVASALTVAAVDEVLRTQLFRPNLNGLRPGASAPAALEAALQLANERIYREARAERKRAGMGTTATLALVRDGKLALAHVGDSRAYLVTGADRAVLLDRGSHIGRLVAGYWRADAGRGGRAPAA